ncbi:MAG: CopD family protein [Alphaproteobacteria bacterium]|nr:CopD family protein [Alphaproteobacteria bacterium]
MKLWSRVFSRFFTWVWIAIAGLLASAYWMVLVEFGGHAEIDLHVHLMEGTGWLMMGIFGFLYFRVWPKFRTAVAEGNMPVGVEKLAVIRKLVATNLAIGLVTLVLGVTGRYWS